MTCHGLCHNYYDKEKGTHFTRMVIREPSHYVKSVYFIYCVHLTDPHGMYLLVIDDTVTRKTRENTHVKQNVKEHRQHRIPYSKHTDFTTRFVLQQGTPYEPIIPKDLKYK